MKMARGIHELANNMNDIRDIRLSNPQVDKTNKFLIECQLMDCL